MNKAELIKALAELLADKMEIGEEPTNGEVIQTLFPNAVIRNDDSMLVKEVLFTNEMWNSPYLKEGE